VVPGVYTVRLMAGGETTEQTLAVHEDPRIEVDPAVRRAWTETLLELSTLSLEVQALADRVEEAADGLDDDDVSPRATALRVLARETSELNRRARRLSFSPQGWVGPLSADERALRDFVRRMLATLSSEASALGV
jgi:hypothetical protein